ncbi:hypothetical protein KI387_022495, partial [Taxus chinensis]
LAWAHVPDEKRNSMKRKSKELIFVGHCEHVKAYLFLDTSTLEIHFQRDVCVDETALVETFDEDQRLSPIPPSPDMDDILINDSSDDVSEEEVSPPSPPYPAQRHPKWLQST